MGAKRSAAQGPLRAVDREVSEPGVLHELGKAVVEVVACCAAGDRPPRFRRWARRQLRKSVRTFFLAEPRRLDDLAAIHQLRLRGTDLRYAIELLAAVLPASLRTRLYPVIEQLQERLGALNDHAVAIEHFRCWRKEATAPALRRQYQQRIRPEKK